MAELRAGKSPKEKAYYNERTKSHMAELRAGKSVKEKEKEKEKDKFRHSEMRAGKEDTAQKRRKKFHRMVKSGPIFVCICCHRKLFEFSVKGIENMKDYIGELDTIKEGLFEDVIGSESLKREFFIMNSLPNL